MEPDPTALRYAVIAPVGAGVTADPAWIGELARHVEACGFESIVVVEHTVVVSRTSSVYPYDASGRMELADDCPIPDPLELLAFLAGRTTSLGLATGVLVLPNHHPVVLAKRLATLDALSGGRLRVCLGMGWMREEVEACGVDFDSRGRRADEQIRVLRALWADTSPDGVDHDGEFFSFRGAMSWPKPAQADGVPLHVGRPAVAGEELATLVALMREEAGRADRDPDRLELSLGHLVAKIDLDRAARLAAQGASRVVLAMSPTSSLDQAKDELSACAERLALR